MATPTMPPIPDPHRDARDKSTDVVIASLVQNGFTLSHQFNGRPLHLIVHIDVFLSD
jgi:hypothetical protein